MTALSISPLPVTDIGGNGPELVQQAADLLSTSDHRKRVFAEIYRGKQRIKTVDELSASTGLKRKRVLEVGKALAVHDIVKQTKVNGRTAYEKRDFYQNKRTKILALASNPAALQKFPTKRSPRISNGIINIQVKLPPIQNRLEATFITIDDIDSFAEVAKVERPDHFLEISERQFKLGIASILGELGEFKDWGGEVSDLYSSNLVIEGSRKRVAFAFKGPGTKGILTPKKLGHNGDQIQRLVGSPADIFIIQYWGSIAESVIEQLEQLVQLKSSWAEKRLWYGTIDGYDSASLILAYPEAFRVESQNFSSDQFDGSTVKQNTD